MTRRRLLTALLGFPAALLALFWGILSSERRSRLGPRRLSLASPLSDGVTFEGDVILVRRGAKVSAFSSRCPHLGCRLGRVQGEQLICPCHGSRFDLDGHRLVGPAASDLEAIAIQRKTDGRIDVVVPS
jgi:Rieske Fe-S protein